ncbi:hypothetical protein ACP70R_028881 [Stipagrostis hirtigluma subsp. patula]
MRKPSKIMEIIGGGKKLPAAVALTLLAVLLLFLPRTGAAAAAVTSAPIDGGRSQRLTPRGPMLRGPESVAFDGAGAGPYSGVSDGRVLKWNGPARGWSTYAYSPGYDARVCAASRLRPAELTESRCGRPLGLQFHRESGDLYIADAYKGLMRVAPGGGEATVLVTEAEGVPLSFTNGVDVDQVTGDVFLESLPIAA